MIGFSKFHIEENACLNLYRGIAQPALTPYVAFHIATTLSSPAASGQNQIVVPFNVPVGSTVQIDPIGTPDANGPFLVGATTGAGPYTLTLTNLSGGATTLSAAHASGVYVQFSPIDSGAGINEPTGVGGYVRQPVTFNAPAALGSGATTGSQMTNAGQLTWAVATANIGLITHLILWDAVTGGNARRYGAIAVPRQVSSGYQFLVQATTGLTISED